MENQKKQNNSMIIIAILASLLLGVSIAYAVLSSTFTLTYGNVGTAALTWDVGFESGTVTGQVVGTANTTCGAATVTNSTVQIADTTLHALNDKCVYKLKVKNTGGIPAELSTIVPKTPSGASCDTSQTSKMTCGNVTYKLTTDSDGLSILGTGNTIAQLTGTMDLYLIAEFTGTNEAAENQTGGGFTITFTQK